MIMDTTNLERAILGTILLTGKGIEYLDSWWIEEASFTCEFMKQTYRAMKWLSDANYPIDPVIVIHKLEQFFEEIDEENEYVPHEWVYSLANEAPNNGNLEVYVKLLYEACNAAKEYDAQEM